MSNHYCLGRIDLGVGSSALWCVDRPRKLVVFLHGFTGAAEATWHDASAHIRRDALFADADVVFLGYDSLRSQALTLSTMIFDMFCELLADPAQYSNRYLYYGMKRASFHYAGILVVAHSLGGALMRQVALLLVKQQHAYANRLQLLLFAPAHKGSLVLRNATRALESPGLFGAFKAGMMYKVPILDDLGPDSDFIRDIEAGTLAQLAVAPVQCLIAAKVSFGQYENVVRVADFGKDHPFRVLPRRNHTDVCKSNAGYRQVLEDIEEHL